VNLYPAIDLKDNKCVRLTKGKDNTSVIFNENPVNQAIYFEKSGCKRLHVVDLDAAFGRKNINTKSIRDIRKAIKIPIQIGKLNNDRINEVFIVAEKVRSTNSTVSISYFLSFI